MQHNACTASRNLKKESRHLLASGIQEYYFNYLTPCSALSYKEKAIRNSHRDRHMLRHWFPPCLWEMLCKLQSYQLISGLLYSFGNMCSEFDVIRWVTGEIPLSFLSPLFLGQRRWARENFLQLRPGADCFRAVMSPFSLSVEPHSFALCRRCLGKAVFPRPLRLCQLRFLFDICTMVQAVRENNLHEPPTWGTGSM